MGYIFYLQSMELLSESHLHGVAQRDYRASTQRLRVSSKVLIVK